ncbi:Sec-independent protein translocase protein TatB [Rhynchospora pubera]|uniref:Sec-independent protein translocase protein TatB n=1 Tax=Rhynchospora pubera TaxID=906938 RepID=A0AAV8EVN1_9POAL|nr:Sec-independent protein translocase protein TatB [Rhynchospora pubera]
MRVPNPSPFASLKAQITITPFSIEPVSLYFQTQPSFFSFRFPRSLSTHFSQLRRPAQRGHDSRQIRKADALLRLEMFGISYGELFLILGATAVLIGPKDLPKITKLAGRAAGRAIAYVQVARGHFDTIMQQSQASKVHKELQDTMAQLEAIRHEIRSISMINPTPLTRRLDQTEPIPQNNGGNADSGVVKSDVGDDMTMKITKEMSSVDTVSSSLHRQAMSYAKLAESPSIRSGVTVTSSDSTIKMTDKGDQVGLLAVLPVSAETAGLLPKRTSEETMGSDILLDAIVEEEVATNAKQFFSQPENQIPKEPLKTN